MLSEKTPTRLEIAKSKAAKLAAQVKALERLEAEKARKIARREAIKARKAETRVKILLGAAFKADSALNPEILEAIEKVLWRHIKEPRDIEILQAAGFMSGVFRCRMPASKT